jgi:predicted CopG family antitoxin
MATNTAMSAIHVDTGVRKRLQALKKKGETYNELIKRLLRKAAMVDFTEEQCAILDNESNWVLLDDL